MARLCATVLLMSLVESILAANCSIPPVYVDIHKRVVNGTDAFPYGSFIGVGNPFQNQSIWPSLRRNETSFASSEFCSNSNLTNCMGSTGGNVKYNLSTSFKEDAHYSSKDSQDIASQSVKGTDDIHLYTHWFLTDSAFQTLADDAPVEFANAGDTDPGIVGMGSSSTILERLLQLNLIAAKTYSLYIGTGMERAGGVVNGSNTFGGYDAGRFKNPVHTYKMDLANSDYLPVTVTDITIDDPSNSDFKNKSIMDNGKSFEARITTDRYPMLFPSGVTKNFAHLLSAKSSDYSDNSLRLDKPFKGTMTIHIGDFKIKLPSSIVSNATNISPVQENDDDNYDGPFYLSTAFLTQVYLMLDFESSQFHLAEAYQKNNYVIPTTFCPGTIPVPHNYNSGSAFLKQGLIGAVVGGVIGGSAILTALTMWFMFWRRNQYAKDQEKRWAAEDSAASSMFDDKKDIEMETLTPRSKQSLWGARQATPKKVFKLPFDDHEAEDDGWENTDTHYGGRGINRGDDI
ncbi:acid protease [Venturia nashicola]|nr:acid protease [Venturia nashicola]